jgi:adenylate cyclase
LGEIQAVLSLARVHAPVDHKQTIGYLTRATMLLNRVEPIGSDNADGRHMPAEKAQLYSRLGDLEFTQGNFAEALRYYKLDMEGIEQTASQPGERVPRSVAYVNRFIGRALAALKRWNDAVVALQESVRLFNSVNDQMNVLFSQVLLCDAYIESRKFPEARELLVELQRVVGLTPNRKKEEAIVHILKALLCWREDNDNEMALGALRNAKDILRQEEPGYYQVRALMVEAEILISCQDEVMAAKRLREARRCASNLDLEDLRIQIESLMERIDKRFHVEPNDDVVGKLDLSILFADIRGFTRACQIIDQVVMAEFIADFAEMISRQVSLCSGRPIRFLGDCVMAVFGMNTTDRAKEILAVIAAGRICERFRQLKSHWSDRCAELSTIGIGFGVATGEVIVGRFGNKELSEYSAIGGAVNLASRMQGTAEDGEVIVCGATWRPIGALHGMAAARPRTLDLKGIGKVEAHVLRATDAVAGLGRTARAESGAPVKSGRGKAEKRGTSRAQGSDDVPA